MTDLESMNLTELKALAKEYNIKNISKLKKEEVLEVLKQIINTDSTISENKKEKNIENPTTNPVIDYKLTNEGDEIVEGILDILPDGYGFLRGDNYLSSDKDVYISMVQIRRFKLDTGDVIKGISRYREGEKFPSLIFVGEVNG